MNIHEAAENYLEQVLMLSRKKEHVRQIDVCAATGYSRPTVSIALRELSKNGYLQIDEEGTLTLTKDGMKIAAPIYERHCIIARYLMNLGTREETAYADACKIEHDISEESYQNLKKHLEESKK